jgi:beta-glucan synthesis-associated protein KRE6
MIQSWNKFCFTGGVLELSIQLPGGHADAGGIVVNQTLICLTPIGLWPAAWLMGNLARATFKETTMVGYKYGYDSLIYDREFGHGVTISVGTFPIWAPNKN